MLLKAKKKFWLPPSPALWHKASGGGGGGTPAKTQGSLHQNGATSSTTVAVTLAAPVTSGGLVCVAVGSGTTATTCSVTDDKGNTYTVANTNVGSFNWLSFWAAGVTNAPQTITATWGEAHSFSTILVTEFSNVLASSPIDGASVNAGQSGVNTTDGITSNAITTTASGDLIWGACVNLAGNSTLVKSAAFTQDQTQASNFNSEYLIQGSAGSIAATWTGTTSDSFSSLVMAFKHL